MALNVTTTKLLITILILIAGYVVVRIGSSLVISFSKKKRNNKCKAHTDCKGFQIPGYDFHNFSCINLLTG